MIVVFRQARTRIGSRALALEGRIGVYDSNIFEAGASLSDTLTLGPITEARFAEAFREAAVITKKLAASLLGVDEKTLDVLAEENVLRSVLKGTIRRGYTERDLRLYLINGVALPATPAAHREGPQAVRVCRPMRFSERPPRKTPKVPRERLQT